MEPLYLQKTVDSPEVILDPQENIFRISGESRPENAKLFYDVIINWLVEYGTHLFWMEGELKKTPSIKFEFYLEYFNSTSAKHILDTLKFINEMQKQNFDIVIYWCYDEMDEDMLESGKELLSLANMQAVFVKKSA